MFTYILCEFEYGYSGQFYQEVDSNGFVLRMTDLDGLTLNIPQSGEPNFIPYGANVVDANITRPSWAN
jgi:hypothetical protein